MISVSNGGRYFIAAGWTGRGQPAETDGRVHDAVEPAEVALQPLGQRGVFARRGHLHVQRMDHRLGQAFGQHRVVQLFQLTLALAGDHHRGAGARCRTRHRAAEPAVGTGNQHHALGKGIGGRLPTCGQS